MKSRYKRFIVTLLTALIVLPGGDGLYSQTRQRKQPAKKTATQTRRRANNSPKTSSEAKRRHEAVQKEIKLTEQQIKENEVKVTKSLNVIGKLDISIENTTKKIKSLNIQLSKLDDQIKKLEGSIDKNELELKKLREEYLKAVKKMRSTRRNKSDLAFIFSSKSMNQALRRMRYLKEFSEWRKRKTEEINGKIVDLKNEKDALAKAKQEYEIALSLQTSQKEKLANQHKEYENLIADLKKNGKALQTHLKRKQTEAQDLNSLVSKLIAEEQRKASEEAVKKAEQEKLLALEKEKNNKKEKDKKSEQGKTEKEQKSGEYAAARKRAPRSVKIENETLNTETDFPRMKGKLPSPSTGSFTVTSRFGRQNMPDMPDVEYENPGIDAESEAGASARAVYAGKVSGVYILPGYNTVVILNHDGYYTVYGNISNPVVKSGDMVDAGTPLGLLTINEDDSGKSKIHFEVWKNREKLNPLEWLK